MNCMPFTFEPSLLILIKTFAAVFAFNTMRGTYIVPLSKKSWFTLARVEQVDPTNSVECPIAIYTPMPAKGVMGHKF